ncbi:hypothetical protein JCGZ_07891 [Jatropha curcas]|uniref:Uncharacterized protein n=1 Tax=Jatropha curcas TaxID=180498 RepID=A0A067KNV7_JATCU|nr:hypothetical protein JCGZ_07891 [Jatropha curcas]
MDSLERQRRARLHLAYPHARALEKGKNSLRVRDKHAQGVPGSMPVLSTRKSFNLRDREKHARAVLGNTPVPGTPPSLSCRSEESTPWLCHSAWPCHNQT